MPPIDEPEAPAAAPPPPPPPAPESRANYVSVADVFDRLAGCVFSLTPAQAAAAGDAVKPASDAQVAWWGRAPIAID